MIVERAKLGVLTIGRKRPGFDQEWNQIMRTKCAEALRAIGHTDAEFVEPVVDDQTTRAALDRLKHCTALLILQPSLGNGQLALSVAQQWPKATVLWATPERPTGEIVSSCSLVAQHLWASVLRNLHRPFELIDGHPDEASTRETLRRAVSISHAYSQLRSARVGLIGSHAPGFLAMDADPMLIQNRFGAQVHRLSLPQFFTRADAINESAVRDDVQRMQSLNLPMHSVSAQDLATNSRFYLAMRELMKEEALDALAVQCWPEFAGDHAQWPYLALSRLGDEGIVATMEGDVDGAITSLAGKLLGAGVGFLTDWLEHDDNQIRFWHPGMAPTSWLDKPSLGLHFNITKPLVVDGALKVDRPMTIARFWRIDGAYVASAFEGKTIPDPRKLTGNTALLEVAGAASRGGVRNYFDRLLHAGLPHHVAMFSGHCEDQLQRLARMLDIRWVI
jgi:L-fucose isomerase-like protein